MHIFEVDYGTGLAIWFDRLTGEVSPTPILSFKKQKSKWRSGYISERLSGQTREQAREKIKARYAVEVCQ